MPETAGVIVGPMAGTSEVLEVAGREVTITNPDKVFFGQLGVTKLDLVRYYLAVADGALRGAGGRPMALKRYVNGADGPFFFQKRAPESRPDWIETVELSFPSGRTASEVVVRDAAQLAWIVNLGCIDLNPHPIRADDLDHPDELRVDLDPVPGVDWPQIRAVALVVRESLADAGLIGWPKTSGSRGIHVNVRIERKWTFPEVRRAALALARDVEQRAPDLASSKWWKEERHGVFIDYNQNAKDRTVASAYSIRPRPDARASAPLTWDEVATVDPGSLTILTVPARYAQIGDPGAGIDDTAGSLDGLLELSARHETAGPGRCALAAELRPDDRRATACPAVEAADELEAPDRDRPGRRAGRRPGGPRALEAPSSRGLGAPRAGRHPDRLDARPVHDLEPDPAEPGACPAGAPARTGSPRSGLRPVGRRDAAPRPGPRPRPRPRPGAA